MSKGRASVFAKGAIRKGLITRQQAEECLGLASKLRQRGKPHKIEDVFVRKGYMTRAEATSIARRLRPAGSEPELQLSREARVCRSCGKDPGADDDCFRCGADQATGAPGPRGTTCASCSQVVLRGTALCPRCARPIDDARHLRRGGFRKQRAGKVWLDRVILVGTLAGIGWFLHEKAIAPETRVEEAGQAAGVVEQAPPPAALGEAREALKAGDRAQAVQILEAALAKAEDRDVVRTLQRALAAVAPRDRAAAAARSVLEADDDPELRAQLARIGLAEGKARAANLELDKVPESARDDAFWRLRVRVLRALEEDPLESLLRIEPERMTPQERREASLGLLARGRAHQKNDRQAQALRDLRRARAVDGEFASAQFALGLYLLEVGQHEEARRSLKAAVRIDPRPAAPYLALGLTLEAMKDPAGAKAYYEQFLRLARESGESDARIGAVEARVAELGG